MNSDLAVYVHIPFCARKCHYCDFAAYAGLDELITPYVDAVVTECSRTVLALSSRLRESPVPPTPRQTRSCANRLQAGGPEGPLAVPSKERGPLARTVYFGGGTPSLLSLAQLERLLDAIPPLAKDAEVTLEANPATIGIGFLRGLRALGINRLSLGVQAFDDSLLRRLGRMHSRDEAVAAYQAAREAGFANVSIDLIYGLPDQGLPEWLATLRYAIALRPEHLSLYALTVEEHTVLGRLHRRGRIALPDEDAQADMYQLAEDVLGAAGYEHYEISNWAAPGFHAQHNLVYWHNEPYLGVGAAAHSFWDGQRFANECRVRAYLSAIDENDSAVVYCEQIDRGLEAAETLILGLRLAEGIAFENFAARFGARLELIHADTIVELVELGLLDRTPERIALTARGRLLGNEVFRRFLPGQRG